MESEIKYFSSNIYNVFNNVRYINNRLMNDINCISDWWRDLAGVKFKNKFNESEHEIDLFYSDIEDLKNELIILADKIKRAEEERRLEREKELHRLLVMQTENLRKNSNR